MMRLETRASGLLLHPTSLPSPYGVGDLGSAAYAFVDFLAAARQTWWQMLPVGPTHAAHSPYDSTSVFAGNPLLVSLERLVEIGLLDPDDLAGAPPSGDRVDFDAAVRFREQRLRRAFARFARWDGGGRSDFEAFCARSRPWLDDYALFLALKWAHRGAAWTHWEPALRDREPVALARARDELADEIDFHRFLQYLFQSQWDALRAHARARGVALLGDAPIFVAHDSADVWAHRDYFRLDREGRPLVVAGVPPDAFSATGQLWGNPLYDWDRLAERGYDWWVARLATAFERFDAVRIDHFIGFQRYWEIPAGSDTAQSGSWRPGPRDDFFRHVFDRLGPVQLVAEDLGAMGDDVRELRDRFGLPGMRVLQFAFGGDPGNEHLPHHHVPRSVVYPATHDNDTTVGWWRTLPEHERDFCRRYLRTDGAEIHWELLHAAWASVARVAIATVQDLLGLGPEARMNRPGTTEGNWAWRLREGALTDEVGHRLADLTWLYGRAPTR